MMSTAARRSFLKKSSLLAAVGAGSLWPGLAQAGAFAPKAGGRFVDYEAFPSQHAATRKVRVWLPPGYDTSTERHAVLYMHDGQNLFEPADSVAWGAWNLDGHVATLMREQKVRPTIVVGIWNLGMDRGREYLPQAPLAGLPEALRDQIAGPGTDGASAPLSDAYLRFLVNELKPFIDARYRTAAGRADTVIMGSSMGGLISLYALATYPQVFGAAGCVSTHWPMSTSGKQKAPAFEQLAGAYRNWLVTELPDAGAHKLYFDHGTLGIDALYPPFQAKVDQLLDAKGYRQGVDWITRAYPGTAHNEAAWRARLATPLEFLLG
jgi:enterochelin esterase-like enzyme